MYNNIQSKKKYMRGYAINLIKCQKAYHYKKSYCLIRHFLIILRYSMCQNSHYFVFSILSFYASYRWVLWEWTMSHLLCHSDGLRGARSVGDNALNLLEKRVSLAHPSIPAGLPLASPCTRRPWNNASNLDIWMTLRRGCKSAEKPLTFQMLRS